MKITQEDIDNGIRGSIYFCPVANAFVRETGKAVEVTESGIWDENKMIVRNPIELQKFIEDFDSAKVVKPQEFNVEINWDGYDEHQ
jgi:hypothetical protein